MVDPSAVLLSGPGTLDDIRASGQGLSVAAVRESRLRGAVRTVDLAGSDVTRTAALVERLRASGRFDFVSPRYRSVDGGSVRLLNRLTVQFRNGTPTQAAEAVLDSMSLPVIRRPFPDSGYFAYRVRYPADGRADPLSIAAALYQHSLVAWVDPDKISEVRLASTPSDPYYPLQFHLKNADSLAGVPVDINVQPAWNYTTGSSTVKVAVIDDGVHWLHPELVTAIHQGRDYMEAFRLPSETDDMFVPFNNDTHGTAVAGIIAAAHNGAGVAGIAPGVKINAARIFRRTYEPDLPLQYAGDADAADAITWAWATAGSQVINNSWGGGQPSNAITAAVTNAATLGRSGLGSVVVFSAGNPSSRTQGIFGPVLYPAVLANAVAVGAIARSGVPADYTPRGPELDLVAPSGFVTGRCLGEVVTIDLFGSAGCNDGPNANVNYTTTFSGTSAAAPQVAGAVALLLSREPGLTRSQVQARLGSSSDPWGAANDFGAGKLNVVSLLFGRLSVMINGPTVVPPQSHQTWSAAVSGGLAPYTYLWKVNGSPVASSSVLSYLVGAQGFELRLEVGQAGGVGKVATIVVWVNGCPPPELYC